jgi:TonB family protein
MTFLKEHIHGIVWSAIFVIVSIILLLLFGFTTPVPIPEERSILIDFGGGGSSSAGASSSSRSTYQNASTQPSSNSGVTTQDIEEAASMQSSVVPNHNENQQTNTPENTPSVENTPTNRLEDRLGNSNIGNIFGTGTGRGNEGSGTGTGTPGFGTGSNGSGQGPGGIGGSLTGRRQVKRVEPEKKANMFGKVELEIDVDAKGDVIFVRVIRSNCTTCTQSAIDAVKQWKYETKPNSGIQTGPVTIIFDQK